MRPFIVHKGTTVALMEDNINTDQILPSAFLNRIERTGFGEFLFDNWRYLPGSDYPRKVKAEFPLNHPDRQGASILITGDNFAGGSSREHAVWALDDFGFRVVIAGSFSDIFYMNSLKNGMLAISLSAEERQALARLKGDEQIKIDLETQEIVTPYAKYKFSIEEEWRRKLLGGIDDITETMAYEEQIKAYESKWDEFYAYDAIT